MVVSYSSKSFVTLAPGVDSRLTSAAWKLESQEAYGEYDVTLRCHDIQQKDIQHKGTQHNSK